MEFILMTFSFFPKVNIPYQPLLIITYFIVIRLIPIFEAVIS